MKIATPEKASLITELCRKHKDLPSRTIAKMLVRQHPLLFPSMDAARTSVRHRRGNAGSLNRKYSRSKDLHRPNGKAGFVWQFPRSAAPGYDPFIIDEPRVLIMADLHIPFHDTGAIMAALSFAMPRKPTCILLNGDICDMFSISRFAKNPTESSLKNELDSTRQFLGWLRQKFPKTRIIFKEGNHDERFDKYLFAKAPELFGVAGLTLQHLVTGPIAPHDAIPDVEWIADQQKILAAGLSIYHGHEIGKGSIAPPVNPARGLFMRTLSSGLMSHLHKGSQHEETTATGKLIACWSTGCLCGLWPRYSRVNKWTHSAAWLETHRGSFSVTPIRILNGALLS